MSQPKELSEKEREIREKQREQHRANGKKGGLATKTRYGRDYYVNLGKKKKET
ncbi:hypothetical protein [Alkalicoccus luteus]|uniref:hypothetical protein n=1 Tax=Alkalicoccus luteus TaxID=1237094 RepID=UPI0040333DD8